MPLVTLKNWGPANFLAGLLEISLFSHKSLHAERRRRDKKAGFCPTSTNTNSKWKEPLCDKKKKYVNSFNIAVKK